MLGIAEGIRGTNRSTLGRQVRRRKGAALELVISSADRERAIRVGQATAKVGTNLEVPRDFTAETGSDVATEAVEARCRQAAELAGVLDGIVGTAIELVIDGVERVARSQCHRVVGAEQVIQRVLLAAERDSAVIALQANIGLAAEQSAALGGFASVDVKAAFQHENALQIVAQVLGAAQAPTRAGEAARSHASYGATSIGAAIDMALETDASISDAVERHVGRLGKRGAGCGASRNCHCKESFFHCQSRFLFERRFLAVVSRLACEPLPPTDSAARYCDSNVTAICKQLSETMDNYFVAANSVPGPSSPELPMAGMADTSPIRETNGSEQLGGFGEATQPQVGSYAAQRRNNRSIRGLAVLQPAFACPAPRSFGRLRSRLRTLYVASSVAAQSPPLEPATSIQHLMLVQNLNVCGQR